MSIIKTAIKQPVLVNLLFAIVLVAGFFYGSTMTKELFPEVTAPGLYVQTIYPGISAREMEKLVTRPIEDAVADVDGLAHVYSTSADSMSFLWLELDADADIDKAVLDVQSRVNEIRRELPPDIEAPVVRPGQMMMPVVQVALVVDFPASPVLAPMVSEEKRTLMINSNLLRRSWVEFCLMPPQSLSAILAILPELCMIR